ncbi:hypothetical protein LX36DRAFT_663747 [Colletotrichum falcatum]|nr:hypothetical protein LX36DRAFT_663747 [Colletotrichum falcatum]
MPVTETRGTANTDLATAPREMLAIQSTSRGGCYKLHHPFQFPALSLSLFLSVPGPTSPPRPLLRTVAVPVINCQRSMAAWTRCRRPMLGTERRIRPATPLKVGQAEDWVPTASASDDVSGVYGKDGHKSGDICSNDSALSSREQDPGVLLLTRKECLWTRHGRRTSAWSPSAGVHPRDPSVLCLRSPSYKPRTSLQHAIDICLNNCASLERVPCQCAEQSSS